MLLRNVTKKTILSENIILAKTFSEKAFGLLLFPKPRAMIFQTRFGIHTFFMRYAIDVLVLDANATVVKIKSNLKPNNIFLWNPKHAIIIELPEGIIERTETQLGDKLTF